MQRNKKIILAAMFLAMLVILSRFLSIKTPIVKISLGFIPTMLCATYLGWRWSVLVNVLGDLIGALLFPTGPFFVGYTLATAVAGLIYGLFLYWESSEVGGGLRRVMRVSIAVVLVAVIVNMGLNTACLAITTHKAFLVLSGARVVKQLVMIPVHIIVFLGVEKMLSGVAQRYLYEEADDDSSDELGA